MRTKDLFKSSKISWRDSDIDAWFDDEQEATEGERFVTIMPRAMTFKEIWGDSSPAFSLADVDSIIESNDPRLSRGTCNLFLVQGAGVLRTVRVYWHGDGWGVLAGSVGDPNRGGVGDQVFSRDSLPFAKSEPFVPQASLGHSVTLSLDDAIRICKENGLTVTKTY